MASSPVTAAVLIVGNEILSGCTQDVNLAFLGQRLGALGIRLLEARVVPDIEAEIVEAVNALRTRYSYVFTTGGIGPTHDDITSECVAKAFGLPLIVNEEARRRLSARYRSPSDLNAARLRMATMPEGAVLIDNPISAAPGYRIGNVHVMAGVPEIMRAMFDGIAPTLAGGPPLLSRSIETDLLEGYVAAPLGDLQKDFPAIDIGSYPFNRQGRFGCRLVLRGTDAEALAACAARLEALVKRLGGQGKWEV